MAKRKRAPEAALPQEAPAEDEGAVSELETESDEDESDEGLNLDGKLEAASDDDEDEDEDDAREDDDAEADGGGKSGENKETSLKASFDFCQPHEKYFHAMRCLLRDHPAAVPSAVSLTEALLDQCEVTSLVTNAESEEHEVFALLSALKYGRHATARALGELILRKCPKAERTEWRAALEAEDTAVLVSARMLNLPMPLVPALYKCFLDDVRWATTTEDLSEEARRSFVVARVVCVCPVDLSGGSAAAVADDRARAKKARKESGGSRSTTTPMGPPAPPAVAEPGSVSQLGGDHYFQRYDEEFLVKDGTLGFRMTLGSASGLEPQASRSYFVALVPWDKFQEAVDTVESFSSDAGMEFQVDPVENVRGSSSAAPAPPGP